MRANRATKRQRREMDLTEVERKVETFLGEMRSAVDSLRTELLTADEREERDR